MAPWTKEAGPLGKAIKNGDILKKKVDQTVKESNKLIGNKKAKDKDALLQQMYQNCIDTKTLIEAHNELVENLKEDEEPNKIKDFEKKKTAELTRCTTMKTQLTETMGKLLPDTTESEFVKTHAKTEEKETDETEKAPKADDKAKEEDEEEEEDEEDEDDDEEEEEDDEEDEEEEEEEEESTIERPKSKVPPLKNGLERDEEDDDDEDDEEDDEEDEEDDEEEEEEDTKDEKSLAKLKSAKREEEDEEDDGDEDEDDEEEDEEDDEKEKTASEEKSKKKPKDKKKAKKEDTSLDATQSTHKFTTVDDYEGEEGDLNFTKGDILTVLETREDGWWLAENEAGEKGLVPSTYLQKIDASGDQDEDDEEEEDEENEDGSKERRGKKLWGSLRTAISDTTVSDVLHAMGAVPSGFRHSTLCRKFNESDTLRMASYMVPKLSQSNISYRDLFFNPATNKIRPRPTRIERVVTLMSGLQIPPPGAGIDVLDRHVRMCLFDGQHILSNIHSVKVGSVDKSQRNWAFTTKVSDHMDIHSHAEVFVRTNDTMDNIGLLCELCVTYTRTSSKEKGEFSCGWALMPLLDESGAVVMNKTFDLRVNGGTPYEKGVEVDPSISRRSTSNALVSLISGNKQPRLALRVSMPKQQHKDLMDTLPDTIVGNTSMLQLMSLYRQCLCDVLLRDRLDLTSTELIHSPVLKGFPQTADIPDLMTLFRTAWHEKLREVKRTEKRDEEFMKDLFRQVYLETVYPVSHLASLPDYRMGDHDNFNLRAQQVKRFIEMKTVSKGTLAALLSPDLEWEPLNLDEMAFNVIGPHCLPRAITAES